MSAPPDDALQAAAAAYTRGDFAAARRHLAGLPPLGDGQQPDDAALAAQIRAGLRLDPAIILTGIAFLALWAALFFGSVT
ncbi:MAG: hypothetical protein KC613_17180 [Myxococcales bacterium]|nr:hypothetical protein [Myxococcales bacterium]MCB9523272.1 hypothetical protein [Myxococcales bacterium]